MADRVSILQPRVEDQTPFGARAEALAVDHLQRQGLKVVMTNFSVPVGRNRRGVQKAAEIDIIALDGHTLCFIEVKARRNIDIAPPLANIDLRKKRQIIRAARIYRRIFGIGEMAFRYDALSIVWPHGGQPNIDYLRSYWDEGAFRKRIWQDSY